MYGGSNFRSTELEQEIQEMWKEEHAWYRSHGLEQGRTEWVRV